MNEHAADTAHNRNRAVAIGEPLKKARSRASRCLAVLDAAHDYDPIADQRYWIAHLEVCIARSEAVRSSRQGSAAAFAPAT